MNDPARIPSGRRQLTALARAAGDVIRLDDAQSTLSLTRTAAAKRLARWAEQGWLRRVGRGAYLRVPLDSLQSEVVLDDPWLLVPALLVSYFASQNFKVFHPRYLSVAVPAYLALLAAGFADLSPRRRAGLGGAVALLWAFSLHHHYFDPRYGKEDMRAAGALLTARAVAGERIVAANTADLLFYYYRGPVPISHYWLGWAADSVARSQRLDRLIADAPGAWVVLSRGEDIDPTGAFARHLDERHPDAERFRFEGVRMWHLRRPAPAGSVPIAGS